MSWASVHLQVWEIGEFKHNDLKIYTCRFLGRRSTLLGSGKEKLAQCQDIVTEWDIRPCAGYLFSHCDNTIKSPWVCTVPWRYPSWYDLRCCQDVKQTNLPASPAFPHVSCSCDPVWCVSASVLREEPADCTASFIIVVARIPVSSNYSHWGLAKHLVCLHTANWDNRLCGH